MRKERIINKLQNLSPTFLEVIDESSLHHGHSGWNEKGETHFRVNIRSKIFNNLSRIERHRLIQSSLAEEFSSGLHALKIEARED